VGRPVLCGVYAINGAVARLVVERADVHHALARDGEVARHLLTSAGLQAVSGRHRRRGQVLHEELVGRVSGEVQRVLGAGQNHAYDGIAVDGEERSGSVAGRVDGDEGVCLPDVNSAVVMADGDAVCPSMALLYTVRTVPTGG
jgi:hypothetical protein